jgi:hypothetical protein
VTQVVHDTTRDGRPSFEILADKPAPAPSAH